MLIPFTPLRSPASRKRCSDSGAPISRQCDPSAYLLFVNDSRLTRSLEPRKGGGGKGRGPTKGSGSGGKSGGKTSKVPLKGGSTSNGKKSATSYGAGGGRSAPISLGQPFAGRTAGGGRRSQVYGSRIYGSGYYSDDVVSRGVRGRGFPFFFWPIVWPGPASGPSSYLHNSDEYGLPENSSRPGGPLATAQFQSKNMSSTFVVLSDESTVSSLIGSVKANCSDLYQQTNASSSPTPYTNSSTTPRPEQALQYYRASSVVLALDGYNDTAALDGTQNPNVSTLTVPLPNGTDTVLLACLNDTIGLSVPLIDAGARSGPPGVQTLVFVWVLAAVARSLF